jgi:hypothetical protein
MNSFLAQLLGYLETADARKEDVEHDHVEGGFAGARESLFAIVEDVDRDAGLSQASPHHVGQPVIVLDYQHPHEINM